MKRLLIILICIWATNVVSAQNADQRIADLINAEDWFALDEEYPRIKDSVQTDFLRPMAEAMLYLHFNQPQDAITAIKQLLSNHQEQISSSTTLNFAILLLQTMGETGRYAEAADGLKSLAEQLPELFVHLPAEMMPVLIASMVLVAITFWGVTRSILGRRDVPWVRAFREMATPGMIQPPIYRPFSFTTVMVVAVPMSMMIQGSL